MADKDKKKDKANDAERELEALKDKLQERDREVQKLNELKRAIEKELEALKSRKGAHIDTQQAAVFEGTEQLWHFDFCFLHNDWSRPYLS